MTEYEIAKKCEKALYLWADSYNHSCEHHMKTYLSCFKESFECDNLAELYSLIDWLRLEKWCDKILKEAES